MPKGVTDTVTGSVDLGSEIGVADRQLRTRRLVVQPGGVVPFHSHKTHLL
jgi:quercetin dioxygenase-like cupin family protein